MKMVDIKNETEFVKCDLCNSDEFALIFKGYDYLSSSPLFFEL